MQSVLAVGVLVEQCISNLHNSAQCLTIILTTVLLCFTVTVITL
jgi:hypothetical protein